MNNFIVGMAAEESKHGKESGDEVREAKHTDGKTDGV